MGKRINTAKWIESANRWQINVQKDGVRKTFTCATPGRAGQRECNAKADAWLDNNIDSGVKVEKMYNQWIEEVKLLKGTGCYLNYDSFGRNHILPMIGRKKLSNLTEQDLQNVINEAHKKGLSMRSLYNIRGCMQTFLKFARKCKATFLICESLELPKDAPRGSRKTLQPEEIKRLLAIEDDEWYLNAFKFFVLTGIREGELIALTKDDVKNGKLYINKAMNRHKELTGGKSDNAQRNFFLTEQTVEIVEKQLEKIKALKTDYLFPAPTGDISVPQTLYKHWRKWRDKHEFTQVTVHELRHTFISMCKEVPLELLKQVVGHSVTMDTFRQYGHEMQGDKERAKAFIEESFSL